MRFNKKDSGLLTNTPRTYLLIIDLFYFMQKNLINFAFVAKLKKKRKKKKWKNKMKYKIYWIS